MIRKFIATAALSGALALGATGIAGASGSTTATGAPAKVPALCAKAPAALAHLQKLNAEYQAWLPKAQAREAAAVKANQKKLAAKIESRIDRAQKAYNRGAAAYKKIEAKCPGAAPSSGGTTGSTGGSGTAGSTGGSGTAG
jgi:hypothetical protein